jgi:hypothetical protein
VGKLAPATALVLVLACGAPPAPRAPQAPPRARVQIAAATCVDPPATEAVIVDVLERHRAMDSGLRVDVTVAPPTVIQLRVVRLDGDVGLDRTFQLEPADCASAAQLLALSVDRWLSAFPEWAEPPPPPAPAARWIEVHAGGALSAIAMPLGAEARGTGIVDHGGHGHRFGAALHVRATIPQRAGRGRFQQTSLLAGASWRHPFGVWEARAEIRGGAMLVSGIGFADNGHDWLPWWEVAVFGGRGFGWGTVGVELAATALQHRAVTRDGLVSEDIPLLRVGVAGTFGVRTRDP